MALCYGGSLLFGLLDSSLLHFIIKVCLAAVLPNGILLALTFHTDECRYLMRTLLRKLPFGKQK